MVNDWLRRTFARRPGQVVLQTWHGTPLKRLALHRPGFDPRRMAAVIKESRRWNVLLAQNPYAARILGKAYAFLSRPDLGRGVPAQRRARRPATAAATRAALGIRPDERVLLYAPTWRDDRTEMVDFVDPAALADATDSVVLVRGHSRTLLPGRDAEGPRVIDVTGFPDTSQLLLAADALITDYSSVMFDFSVTGKPMYFLVPDIEHYRGELRGFYFDLAAHAPGPVVRTAGRARRGAARRRSRRASPRSTREWREKFNARDDGHAAERVVARILDQGFVDADWLEPARRGSGQRRVPVAEPRRVDGVVRAAQHPDDEAPCPTRGASSAAPRASTACRAIRCRRRGPSATTMTSSGVGDHRQIDDGCRDRPPSREHAGRLQHADHDAERDRRRRGRAERRSAASCRARSGGRVRRATVPVAENCRTRRVQLSRGQ